MSWISNLAVRNTRFYHLAAVVALSITLAVGQPDINRYVTNTCIAIFYQPFMLMRNRVVDLYDLAQGNEQMRQALVDASMKVSLLEEAGRENQRLRQALGFGSPGSYSLLPAKVISVYGGELLISAVINKGLLDSVYIDAPVINQDGLIGRIQSVSDNYATVQLLTDPANRVAARVSSSREMGIVKSLTPDNMILDNFPIQGSVSVGDLIISSGLGGIYAAGLTVGTVTEVTRPDAAAFCIVRLKPSVNFRSIEEMFILRYKEQ